MTKHIKTLLPIRRRQRGYALISVLVIGLWAIAFLLAIAGLARNSYMNEAHRRYSIELRNAAEAGLDYAIGQYNTSAAIYPPQVPSLDPPPNQQLLSTSLPTTYFLTSLNGASNQRELNNMTVTITVKRIPPPAAATWNDIAYWSTIYSTATDSTLSAGTVTSPPKNNVYSDYWRTIEATAQYRDANNNPILTRTIRTILEPQFTPAPTPPPPGASQQSYFSNPVLGNQQLNFAPTGNLIVQGVGAPSTSYSQAVPTSATAGLPANQQVFTYQLNLATNSAASVGPNADVRGNIVVNSFAGAPTQTTVSVGAGGIVEGTVSSNGSFATNVTAPPGASIAGTSNVYADADLYNPATNPTGDPNNPLTTTTRFGSNNTSPSQATLNPASSQTPPAPGASTSASANPLPSLSGSNPTLSPGDYTVSSLDTTNTQQFTNPVTAGSSTSSTPVRIYVQGGDSNSNAVNINTNMFNNASADAGNLQIWYQGSNPVNINMNGNPFTGLIYAPNSTVTTTGSGTFEGAIVGNIVNINHQGNFNVRTDLTAGGSPSQGLTYQGNATYGALPTGYKPVVWEEL